MNHKTDWQSFKLILKENINLNASIKSRKKLDEEIEKYIKIIQQAAWQCTPEIKRRLKGNSYPREILMIIKNKRRLRRKWQQTSAPQDKAKLNKLSTQLKEEIKQLKNDSIRDALENLTSDKRTDYSLWKATKTLKRPIMHSPPIKNYDGSWAKSNAQTAKRFPEYLQNIFHPYEGATKNR